MTQTTNGIEYPQEPMLLVRPCLIDICARVRPAAKMLSALLYHARGCTDDVFHVYRSQSQLASDTIEEVCEKTLCDVATPVLRILGFIEADASTRIIHYTVHMDRIRQAVIAYKQDVTSLITLLRQSVKATLETVLKSPTLETVLKSLETVLKSPLQHKNQFQCSLEPVLMIFRASSKVKRGRKPKPEDEREAQSEGIENKRESIEIDTGDSKENTSVTVVTDAAPFRPYAEGHAAIQIKSGDVSFPMTLDDLEAAATRLLTAAAQDIQPPKISTPVIPSVDTVSHIVKATRKEAAPPTTEQPHLITTKAALQDALPQSATSPPTRETRKRGKVKIPPTPEEIALQERCRGLQAQVNEWRGYGLTKGGAIINEHKCVRALCEQYTDEQVRHIREYLFTTHWRWSKPDNRYTIGACTILEEAGNVTQILKNGTAPAKKAYREEELVEWQGQWMTEAEADKLGFNGGFGAYK